MLHLDSEVGFLSYEKAKEYFNSTYPHVGMRLKVQLKCWLFYCESRHKGGKLSMFFFEYKRHMRTIDYIELVKSGLIDVDDIGSREDVIACLVKEVKET